MCRSRAYPREVVEGTTSQRFGAGSVFLREGTTSDFLTERDTLRRFPVFSRTEQARDERGTVRKRQTEHRNRNENHGCSSSQSGNGFTLKQEAVCFVELWCHEEGAHGVTHATCRLSRELCVAENICATGEAFTRVPPRSDIVLRRRMEPAWSLRAV